jgi:hypothetical protein
MSQFPVETGDIASIAEGVNYLLSGPGGLGQNFAGFSSYTPAYLTGNFRIPFSQTAVAELYVAPFALSLAQQLDDRTIKYTFASAQPTPPFSIGNGLTVTGVTPSTYNSLSLRNAGYPITQIGVVECTTTYVIVRTRDPITTPLGTYVSGGLISYTSMETLNSTDCDVRVTVNGATDRVFISAQIDQLISYQVGASTEDLTIYVDISRFQAFPNNSPVNPDFIFDNLYTVTEKVYEFPGLTGTGTLDLLETVFTAVVDSPDPGYYRYILEVYFLSSGPDLQVYEDEFTLRSISAQVVKQ